MARAPSNKRLAPPRPAAAPEKPDATVFEESQGRVASKIKELVSSRRAGFASLETLGGILDWRSVRIESMWKPPFSAEEIYRAHRLLVPEEEARELAAFWENPPEEIPEDAGVTLPRGSYVLLWLLGGETAEKVKSDYLDAAPSEERAVFEEQVDQMRSWLESEGKL